MAEATKGLSEAQWNFKRGPERWSVAEVLEHIVLVEDFLLENTSQEVMQAPAGKADRDYAAQPTPGDGTMVKYQDVIELKSDDRRLLISIVLGDNGKWHQVTSTTYRRKKL